MSQIGTEKDISLIWKIRRVHSNYVCVCVREREREREREMGKEVGMDERTA